MCRLCPCIGSWGGARSLAVERDANVKWLREGDLVRIVEFVASMFVVSIVAVVNVTVAIVMITSAIRNGKITHSFDSQQQSTRPVLPSHRSHEC